MTFTVVSVRVVYFQFLSEHTEIINKRLNILQYVSIKPYRWNITRELFYIPNVTREMYCMFIDPINTGPAPPSP